MTERPKRVRGDRRAAHDRRASDLPLNAKVFVDVVDDPYALAEGAQLKPARRNGEDAPGAPEWVENGQPKIAVIRSIRNDPIADMWARRQIAEYQFNAGRHWQAIYERSSIGSVQAVDTTKEPVDGGSFPEAVTDSQRKAMRQMESAMAALGKVGDSLVMDVLGHSRTIAEAARNRGAATEREIRSWAFLFRECLTVLAVEFGYSTPRKTILNFDKGAA